MAAPTHEELKQVLESQGQQNLWYSVTNQYHRADHRVDNISYVHYPYREPANHQELLHILATAAGTPARDPSPRYSKATIHILPAAMSQKEWLEAFQLSSPPRHAAPHEREPRP